MEEIWKDIPGYKGLYQASSYGRIKSLARTKLLSNNNPFRTRPVRERMLKYWLDKDGYYHCTLFKDQSHKQYQVHSLIWLTFHAIEYNRTTHKVDHIDDCKTNNNPDNMQLLTNGENIGKGYQHKGKLLPPGVTMTKHGRYVARIQINKKQEHIGTFDDPLVAYQSYQDRRLALQQEDRCN